MKRPRVRTAVVGIVVLVVILAVSSFIWLPGTLLHRNSGLAKEAGTEQQSSSPTPGAVTLSTAANIDSAGTTTPTPVPTPTQVPTPTPIPVATPAIEHQTVTAANGISIGCQPSPPNNYLTCLAKEPTGFSLTFYLYLPDGYHEGTKYPLVLFLEGGGQRANPNNSAALNRIGAIGGPDPREFGPGYPGPYSINVQGRWPSFIVIPQLLNTERFVDVPAGKGSYTMASEPNDSMRLSKEIVDTLQLIFDNIDPNRLYITGYSMGGYGTWEMAERWPDYWAAAAPIAGAGDPSKADLLVNLPIWAFQSADDTVVPISASRDMIAAIRAAGGNPRYTEYTNLGHGSWVAPYTIMNKPSPTVDFFSWLFAQHK